VYSIGQVVKDVSFPISTFADKTDLRNTLTGMPPESLNWTEEYHK
jgi:hypothetical protein